MTRRLPLLTLLVLIVTATPAAADPAGPTNYRSTVVAVEPDVDGVAVEIVGGDAFVTVTVAPGVTVEIAGYEGEPYLRYLADGTIERNAASPARWLNDARFGARDVTPPPEAATDVPPRWEVVATGGAYAWHDHRVHWMSPEAPRQVDVGAGEVQRVQTWELDLTVDGQPVRVSGELDWLPSPTPLPGLALALSVAAVGVLLVIRRPAAAPLVGGSGAGVAGVVGLAGSVGLPPGADAEPALLVLPAAALVVALVGWRLGDRPGVGPRLVAALSGLPILVWSLLLLRALASPIVPTALPDAVARLLIAVTLGTGLVAVVAAARAIVTADAPAHPAAQS